MHRCERLRRLLQLEILQKQQQFQHHHVLFLLLFNELFYTNEDSNLQDTWVVGLPRRDIHRHSKHDHNKIFIFSLDLNMQNSGVVWLFGRDDDDDDDKILHYDVETS